MDEFAVDIMAKLNPAKEQNVDFDVLYNGLKEYFFKKIKKLDWDWMFHIKKHLQY